MAIRTEHFGLFLMPGFTVFSIASLVEPLRVANRLSAESLYRWALLSLDGETTTASNGFRIIPDASIRDAKGFDTIAVCGGFDAHMVDSAKVMDWLRRSSRHGTSVGGITTGSWLLARAGLLDDRRCTVHWEDIAAFREAFPSLTVTTNLWEIDGDRFTCGGGTAILDMALHLIARRRGQRLAIDVSEQFVHNRMREDHESQRIRTRDRLAVKNAKVVNAVELMESNLESTLSLAEIAHRSNTSRRHLERLFNKHFGKSPSQYYRAMRLQRARRLLAQTPMTITQVALACGFRSPSNFSRQYRRLYGSAPTHDLFQLSRSPNTNRSTSVSC